MISRPGPLRLIALALALLALHPSAAQARQPACHRPRALTFKRHVGSTVGTLSWRAPAHAARHGRGMRYRVMRDGHVVGQTRRRSLRIRVRLGHVHRFAVVPLGAHGRPSRCGAAKRMRVAYMIPGRPLDLSVSGGEAGLQVSWRRGARGDGKLGGYRLLRNGATIGQTSATSWTLPASALRSYRFAVAAVDTRGHASRPSNVITIVTGHRPPAPPVDVQALPVSASELGVQWTPTSVDAGHVVGYRVLRDGATTRQIAGTSYVLSNLFPSTDYHIAVVAIDNLGYASAPSRTVVARTQDPVPSSGHAQAFLLASTDESFADFRAHYRQIGLVYPTYYGCTPDASLEGADDPLVTRWAQARSVRVLPRVNCQRPTVIHQILTDAATRQQWIDRLVALAQDVGYDGVSIDFEAGPASDRAALTSFVAALAERLHADGKLLTIAVSPKVKDIPTHPRSGIFDYPALAPSADWLFVMCWGLHWSTSVPGAQDDATWVSQVAGYVGSLALHRKFVYGTNLYAIDWPSGGGPSHPGTAYQYEDLVPRLPSLGASIQLDSTTDSYHATYTDGGGAGHDVWYPDATTVGWRIRLAAQDGLGGVGFWRLGAEDQRLWEDALLAPGAGW
jgi:spore germination protein YaaH